MRSYITNSDVTFDSPCIIGYSYINMNVILYILILLYLCYNNTNFIRIFNDFSSYYLLNCHVTYRHKNIIRITINTVRNSAILSFHIWMYMYMFLNKNFTETNKRNKMWISHTIKPSNKHTIHPHSLLLSGGNLSTPTF